jgi:hypothetical protein
MEKKRQFNQRSGGDDPCSYRADVRREDGRDAWYGADQCLIARPIVTDVIGS